MRHALVFAVVVATILLMLPASVQARYTDGMNLYEYVNSSPILRVDPLGLEVKRHGKPDKFMNCHGYTLGVILGNKQLAINRQLPGYSDVAKGGETDAQMAKAYNSASFAAVLQWRGITYDQLLANTEEAPGKLKAMDYALHTAIIFEMFADLKNEGCERKAMQTSNTGGWYNDKPCTDDPDACDFVMMIRGHEFTVGGKKVKLFTAVHSAVRCKNGSWETVLGAGKEIITADQPDKLLYKNDKEDYFVYDFMVSWGCPKCKCKTDK